MSRDEYRSIEAYPYDNKEGASVFTLLHVVNAVIRVQNELFYYRERQQRDFTCSVPLFLQFESITNFKIYLT